MIQNVGGDVVKASCHTFTFGYFHVPPAGGGSADSIEGKKKKKTNKNTAKQFYTNSVFFIYLQFYCCE